MRDEKIICYCRNITVGKLKNAIKNGASTYDEVVEKTGVSQSCGKCKEHAYAVIEELIRDLHF